MVTQKFVDFTRSGVFAARYRGSCGNCHAPIEVGDDVRYDGSTLIGDECCTNDPPTRGPAVMPRGKMAADRCGQCFMVHATGQTECE